MSSLTRRVPHISTGSFCACGVWLSSRCAGHTNPAGTNGAVAGAWVPRLVGEAGSRSDCFIRMVAVPAQSVKTRVLFRCVVGVLGTILSIVEHSR